MKLIIGGSCQGKLARAMAIRGADARIADGAEAALDSLKNFDVLDKFHLFVRREVENGGDAEQLARAVIGSVIMPPRIHARLSSSRYFSERYFFLFINPYERASSNLSKPA